MRHAPTLFVDFDGTLHAGSAYFDREGGITLDSGRPTFEFAPILAGLLSAYPDVEIVLTTSWLDSLPREVVIAHLPPALSQRVVDTTAAVKPRFGAIQDGTARTYVIAKYAYEHRLASWLAIDDSVYGTQAYGDSADGNDDDHFLLLDSSLGLSEELAQKRIRRWLDKATALRKT